MTTTQPIDPTTRPTRDTVIEVRFDDYIKLMGQAMDERLSGLDQRFEIRINAITAKLDKCESKLDEMIRWKANLQGRMMILPVIAAAAVSVIVTVVGQLIIKAITGGS